MVEQNKTILRMKRIVLYLIASICLLSNVIAQKESKDVRSGNGYYKDGKFVDAEIAYRKGLSKNKEAFEANYNLGNALYKQAKYKEALEQYGKASTYVKDKKKLSAAYHNVGNALYQAKEYDKSIDAYKASLKMNPEDAETRYNLALAKTMLKKQQEQKQDKKDNKDNKDQNKQEQQQPKPQQNKMSEENAKQILDAFVQDEKDVQNRVKENQKKQAQKRQVEKDW